MIKIKPELLVQPLDIKDSDLKIKYPFSMSISGPSLAGKSQFILQLIKHRDNMFDCNFTRIIFCTPSGHANSDYFEEVKKFFPRFEHYYGIPDLESLNLENNTLPVLLIVDDLVYEFLNSSKMVNLITKEVHHKSLGLIFTSQNYFEKSKFGRTIMKNCHYRVLFYNRIDQRELSIISSQIANCPKFLSSNFEFLFNKFPNDPSHYLMIDGSFRNSLPDLWCKSRLFPDQSNNIAPIFFLKNPKYCK